MPLPACKPRLRQLRLARAGTTVIEFAAAAPVFLLMLLGIFEFGRALWMQETLQYAVQQAARCASVNQTICDNNADTAAYAASQVIGFAVNASTFTASHPSCGNQVTANLPFQFVVSALFPYSITLSARSCYPG
jgi:Flp pilus assembly protein TadG